MSAGDFINDAEIISLLSQKDVSALALLYDKYAAPLYGTILKLVGDEKTACSVLEATFSKIWKEGLKPECFKVNLFSWMNNLARDLSLASLNERIKRQEAKEKSAHYKTAMGNVLKAVTFN